MKESSYMIVVPKNPEDIMDPGVCIKKLGEVKGVNIDNVEMTEESIIHVILTVNDMHCEFDMFPTDVDIPPEVNAQHFFSDVDVEAINNTQVGLVVDMEYTGDPQTFYHNQLKIIHALVPEKLAILDAPSEKILSGKWVALAAESEIMPAPRYIYTVQAISGDDDEVWLHTHGLGRCGFSELEILCSNKNIYNEHYRIIETVANRMLENNEQIELGSPFFIAWVTNEVALVVTLVNWKEALDYYPGIELGGMEDREDPAHAEDNACIMIYRTPKDADNKNYKLVTELDEYLKENPIFMLTTKETKRMSCLAKERVDYMKRAFQKEDTLVIVKIGLEPDEEFFDPDNPEMKEHIWFELLDIDGDNMKLKLTQEPYYVKGLHEGDIQNHTIAEITDWLIYTKERRLTPDDVYILGV